MFYYTITTEDFRARFDEVELISVQGNTIYLQSETELKKPYTPLESLPEALAAEWGARLKGLRESKESAIQSEYERLISEGVEYKGAKYACTEAMQQALVFASLFGGAVKASDGTAQTLTKSQITALGKAIATRIGELATMRDNLLAELKKLESVSEICAFSFSFGINE